jgi:hypothetical protein
MRCAPTIFLLKHADQRFSLTFPMCSLV